MRGSYEQLPKTLISALKAKVEALETSLAEAHALRDQKQAALWELQPGFCPNPAH